MLPGSHTLLFCICRLILRSRDRIKSIFIPCTSVLIAGIVINLICVNAVDAFHEGGVGQCGGCHVMHNPQGFNNSWLLPGTDASSVCLTCHAGTGSPNSNHIASPDGSAMTPGGDFYWLQKNFFWAEGSSPDRSHGHNIVAKDYGFTADSVLLKAPGGTYSSSDLGCTSCHDPHGKVNSGLPISASGSYGFTPVQGTALGNYRMLGGSAYDGGEHVQGYYFNYNAPIARQNSIIQYGETDTSHVSYGSGMSEWCANCHEAILFTEHTSINHSFNHPSGYSAFLGDSVDWYNSYIKTGDFSGGRTTAYLALVPFERGIADTTLLDPASTLGPDSNSRIICLTCHRAHASAFPHIGRWDFSAELIADSHPAPGDSGVTGSDILYSYYGRDMVTKFGPGQRSLCEKCHDVPRDGYPAW